MIRWISVEDDLPPKGEKVLVYVEIDEDRREIFECVFNPKNGWDIKRDVLFWAAYPNVPVIQQSPKEFTSEIS